MLGYDFQHRPRPYVYKFPTNYVWALKKIQSEIQDKWVHVSMCPADGRDDNTDDDDGQADQIATLD